MAPGIFDDIKAEVTDSQFGLATFVDFPFTVWGYPPAGDYAYQLDQDLTAVKATWTGAINAMSTRDGNDSPESQYEALYQAATGTGRDVPPAGSSLGDIAAGQAPSWRDDATKVIAITTDAAFHNAGDGGGPFPYPGPSAAATIAALQTAGIKVIAIKAGSATTQMDAVANATGGSIVTTGNTSAEIAEKILEGLEALTFDITASAVGCDPLSVTFVPAVHEDVSGPTQVVFTETITVPGDAAEGSSVSCTVEFKADDTVIGTQSISVTVPDTTPPVLTVPSDQDNEATDANGTVHDFWGDISATDNVDPSPSIVCDHPVGWLFPIGDTVVTCTATDSSGLTDTESFTKTVGDTTPPVLTMPPDETNEATSPDGAVHEFEVSAEDAVDGPVPVDCGGWESGDMFPMDDTVVTCTATDEAGNEGSGTFTKTVVDTTPPEVGCVETVNPHGKKKPKAPGKGGQGQNQDGFYVLTAEDLVDPEPEIDVSGFGGFSDGDNVKITEAPDATPSSKKMGSGKGQAGAIAAHLILNGDPVITATDAAGNTATATCLVPPPPK